MYTLKGKKGYFMCFIFLLLDRMFDVGQTRESACWKFWTATRLGFLGYFKGLFGG
jgi:hypothetical protein